ncbi:MAG TPA: hypothetical protein VIH93_09980 [Thermoanaerobaculia bacterium]
MDEAEAAEAPHPAAQPADVRQGQAVGVADDDVADRAVAAEEDADLAAELARDRGEVPGELGRDDLARLDAAPERALEGAELGRLDAAGIAFDVGDRGLVSGGWVERSSPSPARRRAPCP